MKIAALVLLLVLAGCINPYDVPLGNPDPSMVQQPASKFYPAVGMTEADVIAHWGRGGNTSYIDTPYSNYKTAWYTRHIGGVMSGCSREVARGNPFYLGCVGVHYEDGKVMAVSWY